MFDTQRKNILTEIAATISELAKGDNNIKN